PRQPLAATGATGADWQLVADQLATAVGEDRRPFDKARPLLLAAAGGEPSDAAAVCRHAAEDRGAAVAGRIVRVQRGANFDDDAGAQEKVSAEPFGKRVSPGVACPPDAKPAPPGAAGNPVDQHRLKTCTERSYGLYKSWNLRVKTEIPVNSGFTAVADCATAPNVVPFNSTLVEQFTRDAAGNSCGVFTESLAPVVGTPFSAAVNLRTDVGTSTFDPTTGLGKYSFSLYSGGTCTGAAFDSTGA